MKIFDSLVHVTRDARWLGGTRYDASLDRLLNDMDRAGVERACMVAIADYVDNDYVLHVSHRYRHRFLPIGSIRPTAYESPEQVDEAVASLSTEGFVGLKLHPRLNGYDPLDPLCIAAVSAAGHHKLVVFLDTLFRRRGGTTRSAADIVDVLAHRAPQTEIILLHSGGPAMLELSELVCLHPNLTLDLSFSLLRYQGSSLDLDMRFLCTRRDQRVVCGSDFPEYLPSVAAKRILELTAGLPEEKIENVLHKNLEQLFARVRSSAPQQVAASSVL